MTYIRQIDMCYKNTEKNKLVKNKNKSLRWSLHEFVSSKNNEFIKYFQWSVKTNFYFICSKF